VAEEYCWAIRGSGTVMLGPIRFRFVGVWTSSGLPYGMPTYILDHIETQFQLAQNWKCAAPSGT